MGHTLTSVTLSHSPQLQAQEKNISQLHPHTQRDIFDIVIGIRVGHITHAILDLSPPVDIARLISE